MVICEQTSVLRRVAGEADQGVYERRQEDSRAQVIQIVSRHMRLFVRGLDDQDYEGGNIDGLVA
jgi:hypothetical protein